MDKCVSKYLPITTSMVIIIVVVAVVADMAVVLIIPMITMVAMIISGGMPIMATRIGPILILI